MTTERMILRAADDDDTLYLDHTTSTVAGNEEAENYGLDIPNTLVAEHDRLNDEWTVHQIRLKKWFDGWLPDDPGQAEAMRSVVLENYRTWAQYAALADCPHLKAIAAVKETQNPTSCEPCGSYVHYLHARTPDGEWKSTGEIGAM